MNIQEEIRKANARLKAAKMGVALQLRGDRISLVATLPPKPDSTKTKDHQQRIPLGIYANHQGLKQAEAEAKMVGAKLAAKTFEWADYLDSASNSSSATTCGEWIKRFEAHILATSIHEDDAVAADKLWRRRFYNAGLNRLNPASELTGDALIEAAQKTKPNSRSRQLHCQNLQRLANFAKIEVDLSDISGNYSPDKAEPRNIPTRKQIEDSIGKLKSPNWQWAYGMMATYGLRDHEVFLCDVEHRKDRQGNSTLIAKVREGKTHFREVRPLHPEWVERWQLSEVKLPNVKVRVREEYGERVSRAFKRAGIEFGPYDLRHAYAIRASVEYRIPLPVAAALCGHAPDVHLKRYNRWISQQQHDEAWSDAVERHRRERADSQ
jgi:integrase